MAVLVPLSPLAGLVVPSGPLEDDVEAVVGADDGDERHQRGELVVVVVLGGVRPGMCTGSGGEDRLSAVRSAGRPGARTPRRLPPPRPATARRSGRCCAGAALALRSRGEAAHRVD